MRVAALVPYHQDYCAGQRFRVEAWARHLGPRGISFSFLPFASPALTSVLHARGRLLSRAGALARCCVEQPARVLRESRPNVVYIYREAALVGPALIERLTRSTTHAPVPDRAGSGETGRLQPVEVLQARSMHEHGDPGRRLTHRLEPRDRGGDGRTGFLADTPGDVHWEREPLERLAAGQLMPAASTTRRRIAPGTRLTIASAASSKRAKRSANRCGALPREEERGSSWAGPIANLGRDPEPDRLFSLALSLEPYWTNLRANYALYPVSRGRIDDVLVQIEAARALEPGLSPRDALSIIGPHVKNEVHLLRRAAGSGPEAELALETFETSSE
jgi:hypothetical protein